MSRPVENSPLRVGLVLPMEFAFARDVVQGVKEYARPHKPWVMHVNMQDVPYWKPQAIICAAYDQTVIDMVAPLKVPTINVSASIEHTPFPSVLIDNDAVAAMAVDHLCNLGLRRLAYFGKGDKYFSTARGVAFEKCARARGATVATSLATFYSPPFDIARPPPGAPLEFLQWFKGLVYPVGIYAHNDREAFFLAEVCRMSGVRVPDDVAILGTDNETFFCELAWPPLSSIQLNHQRIGYQAATLLDELILGKRVPAVTWIAPACVVARASTDAVNAPDTDLSEVLRFVRRNANQPITVGSILKALPISRRKLEQRMARDLGQSPYAYIRSAHVELAKTHLTTTDWPMSQVARQSGFTSSAVFCRNFRRETGRSPTEFRRGNTSSRTSP